MGNGWSYTAYNSEYVVSPDLLTTDWLVQRGMTFAPDSRVKVICLGVFCVRVCVGVLGFWQEAPKFGGRRPFLTSCFAFLGLRFTGASAYLRIVC